MIVCIDNPIQRVYLADADLTEKHTSVVQQPKGISVKSVANKFTTADIERGAISVTPSNPCLDCEILKLQIRWISYQQTASVAIETERLADKSPAERHIPDCRRIVGAHNVAGISFTRPPTYERGIRWAASKDMGQLVLPSRCRRQTQQNLTVV